MAVIDGRAELEAEVREADTELRAYLTEVFKRLVQERRFLEALPGHLEADSNSPSREEICLARMRALIGE